MEYDMEDLIIDVDDIIPPTPYKEVYYFIDGKIQRDWINNDGEFLFTTGSDIIYDTRIEVRRHINELLHNQ